MAPSRRLLTGLVAALAVGCEGAARCTEIDVEECRDAPISTFDELHASVLRPSCGEGLSCHGADDRPAGDIRFDDIELAYAALSDPARGLVAPGAPHCSGVVQRIESIDPFWRMPPASSLEPAARCAVIRWIRAGAER